MRCFVVKNCAAQRADEKREALVPTRAQLIGKLLLYQPDFVHATDGRV